uniref:Small ribosomal subunit protein uS7c n=1 Tax=Trachelomonas volvocina TaxID=103340 RepID=A0A0G3VSG0_9EUGL|nr:ribosomal protein S7 [Trachelomonas volvocina]AKL82449.1 ribosomal protein S7 [Trachelomonas volvocina]
MSRRKTTKKRSIIPDPIYNSEIASLLINKILIDGKKSLAENIFYTVMRDIKNNNKDKEDAIEVLKKAIKNSTPIIEIKARRVGGATYQVPTEIKPERGRSLALKFIIKSARNRPGKSMSIKLQNEILDAYNNVGNSVKKKEEIHKMAEANKAFTNLKL